MKTYKISKNMAGKRLDVFLSKKFPKLSRSQIQKEIKTGNVAVNSKIVKPAYILKSGDQIFHFFYDRGKSGRFELEANPDIKLDIIFENKDFVVVNKPAGILVHPTSANETDTLVNGLLARYPLLRNVGENKMRPGIVHRLDKDTSGLMVVAKNNEAFQWLKDQFKNRLVEKKYHALVYGKPKKSKGIIISKIGRLKGKQVTGRAIEKLDLKSKESSTEYKVVQNYQNYSLLEVQPKTGRMHQIRVHFASIGHPIVGDKLYKFKGLKPPTNLKRQFLHAYYLSFKTPKREIFEFKVALQKDLKKIIQDLDEII